MPIAVRDAMRVDPAGTLRVVIEDDLWGSTLTFEPGITVDLDGTLELLVDLDDETSMADLVGQTFELFDWTGVAPAGRFDRILTENGLLWDTARLYTTGQVTLLDAFGVPVGDFNNDNMVDQDDLQIWQSGFGISPGAALADGDADLDGDVDGRDFLAWQTGFGTGAGAAASSVSVPEPSTFLLLLAALGAAMVRPVQAAEKPAFRHHGRSPMKYSCSMP